jgi:hypothetical protein
MHCKCRIDTFPWLQQPSIDSRDPSDIWDPMNKQQQLLELVQQPSQPDVVVVVEE